MSKGLEAFKRATTMVGFYDYNENQYMEDLKIIETALKRLERYEQPLTAYLDKSEEELFEEAKRNEKKIKALEIIKKKNVDVGWLKNSETLKHYNMCIGNIHKEITQEEWDLLKEALL